MTGSRIKSGMTGTSSADHNADLSEQIAQAAVKYSLLKSRVGQDIVFDFDESLSFEGNSGPYLQYTYARIRSLLRKSQGDPTPLDASLGAGKLGDVELGLVRMVVRFPEVVETAAKNYSPHVVCGYLYELAQVYNSFYNAGKIVGGDREKEGLLVSQLVGEVIKEGLFLLGIGAPERM